MTGDKRYQLAKYSHGQGWDSWWQQELCPPSLFLHRAGLVHSPGGIGWSFSLPPKRPTGSGTHWALPALAFDLNCPTWHWPITDVTNECSSTSITWKASTACTGDNLYYVLFFICLTFKRRIKSHLPFAGIIRGSPYSTRFQDKG